MNRRRRFGRLGVAPLIGFVVVLVAGVALGLVISDYLRVSALAAVIATTIVLFLATAALVTKIESWSSRSRTPPNEPR